MKEIKTINEEKHYSKVAEYLEKEHECTKAIALGGKGKKGWRWWMPDVVGVSKFYLKGDVMQFPAEIVSVEVKASINSIKGVGQACAYLLFSHRVYFVTPNPRGKGLTETQKEVGMRIESLCHKLGIGLVYFPRFRKGGTSTIYTKKLGARHHSPDMFYVNKFFKDLQKAGGSKERRRNVKALLEYLEE